jgi:hypothetical protein
MPLDQPTDRLRSMRFNERAGLDNTGTARLGIPADDRLDAPHVVRTNRACWT